VSSRSDADGAGLTREKWRIERWFAVVEGGIAGKGALDQAFPFLAPVNRAVSTQVVTRAARLPDRCCGMTFRPSGSPNAGAFLGPN
jgi:hypothetical protein